MLLNGAVFLLLQLPHEEIIYGYSFIPYELTHGVDLRKPILITDPVSGQELELPQHAGPRPIALTLITALFLHGDLWHLLGNSLFLWIFGDNIEFALGRIRYGIFYLVCGIAGLLVQWGIDPESPVPVLGASGAISGLMAAYFVFFPLNRIRLLVAYLIPIRVPAILLIGIWLYMQFQAGWGSLRTEELGGVAYWAHIGGFVFGLWIAIGWRLRGRYYPR